MQLTRHWGLGPPLPAQTEIHMSVAVCSWRGSSLSEEYAGDVLLRRDACPLAVQLQRSDEDLQFHGLRPSMQKR